MTKPHVFAVSVGKWLTFQTDILRENETQGLTQVGGGKA
jgi:hypothetical protein